MVYEKKLLQGKLSFIVHDIKKYCKTFFWNFTGHGEFKVLEFFIVSLTY